MFMRATGNPGNVGSQWVKEMFVDPAEPNTAFDVNISTIAGNKSITRRFIPAKLQDNPYLMQTDDYLIMLSSLPEVQRKQFLEGDWGAFENSAFPEFSIPIMLVSLLTYPAVGIDLERATGGYSSAACVLWIAWISITISGYIESITHKELRQTFCKAST